MILSDSVIGDSSMCGLYTYFVGKFSDLRLTWKVDEAISLLKPRYNIAPSQEAPVIVQADGKRTLELFRWGRDWPDRNKVPCPFDDTKTVF